MRYISPVYSNTDNTFDNDYDDDYGSRTIVTNDYNINFSLGYLE